MEVKINRHKMMTIAIVGILFIVRTVIYNAEVYRCLLNSGTLLEVLTFKEVLTKGLGKYVSFVSIFPSVFFIEALLIRWPLKINIRILYFIQSIVVFFLTAICFVSISFTEDSNLFSRCIKWVYTLGEAYLWSILLFSVWSLALATPLSKLKFFNWPFETRADYIEPKKWIPPRER